MSGYQQQQKKTTSHAKSQGKSTIQRDEVSMRTKLRYDPAIGITRQGI